jgi:hypothetical protein
MFVCVCVWLRARVCNCLCICVYTPSHTQVEYTYSRQDYDRSPAMGSMGEPEYNCDGTQHTQHNVWCWRVTALVLESNGDGVTE